MSSTVAPSPSLNRRRLRQTLICISVAANSLTAGGVFIFPILSPALATVLKLTQPQLTTVALAGILGQYPFSPLVGKVLDLYGPSTCSMISAAFFTTSFLASALQIATAPVDVTQASIWSFYRLTLFFLMAGLGTVFSYFSSLFAASKSFPRHPGLASGFSMALFGLSPLCLSILASTFFMDPTSGLLRAAPFLRFMALLTATTHILGFFMLRSAVADIVPPQIDQQGVGHVNEDSPLLRKKDDSFSDKFPNPFRDQHFWLLALYCLFGIGACEMVISNMGTIVLSLPPDDSVSHLGNTTADTITSNQVKILSISNTLSRLVVGPLADFVSPVACYLPTGVIFHSRKHRISRVVFLSIPAFLLVLAFLWMEIGIKSREALWVLSVATGISYGAMFTVLPSIVSSVWGLCNLGRNFGVLTYAPFIGTPLFSYFYAFVSAAHSQKDASICEGISCWQITFWVTLGTSMLALCGSLILWRQWRGRV